MDCAAIGHFPTRCAPGVGVRHRGKEERKGRVCVEGKFGSEDTMAVAIKPKSTQHTGLAQSMEGSVAAWLVTFQLDEGDSIHATISIPLTGPPSHHEAQEKALKMLF